MHPLPDVIPARQNHVPKQRMMKTKFQKKRKQIVTNMNITIVVSNKKRICKQKKQIAKTKSKLQKQNQIAKRETFANEREREREKEHLETEVCKHRMGEDISLKGGVESQNSPITRNLK
jgi:hypothetical protein